MAMEALDADRDFLKRGDVFTDAQIDGYIDLRMEEVERFETSPLRSSSRCTTAYSHWEHSTTTKQKAFCLVVVECSQ